VLLAIDLGLRCGVALFDRDGGLVRFSSHNFGTRTRLKKAAWTIVSEVEELTHIVVEGDRALGDIWLKAAAKRGADGRFVAPETWRARLLLPREQRSGGDAKRNADALARAVIEASNAKRPTSLRHDVAEAICIGLWGVLELGWTERLPAELTR
jgi:hypothetical protein